MSKIARRERIDTETSEPLLDGGYQTRAYEQFAWCCLGCGLVWPRQHQASNCESRGHAVSYEDGPYGVTYVENGVPKGNPHWYTRRAIRRETSKANVPSARQARASYDADDKAYDAWVEHVAALRVPKDTSMVPAWKAQGILPNERRPQRVVERMGDGAQRLRRRTYAEIFGDDDRPPAAARTAANSRPADVPPAMTNNTNTTADQPPYRGWEAWESFSAGWGVANILANGGFNVRGTVLKGGPYTRAQAEDVARRLNAGDPEAFKLLTQRRFR